MTRWSATALLALAACGGMHGEVETPAVVVHPTPEGRSALAQAVRKALDGTPVTIADDALTQDGALVVERRSDPSSRPASGRDLGAGAAETERFHLIKTGEHCILVRDRTNDRFELIGTACAPR